MPAGHVGVATFGHRPVPAAGGRGREGMDHGDRGGHGAASPVPAPCPPRAPWL